MIQKQLLVEVLQNRCSQKFCNIHRETSVLNSLCNEAAGHTATLTLIRLYFGIFCIITF